jgi:hypothetical protein
VVDAGDHYDGIPVAKLPITDVDVPDPDHLQRSQRYPGAIDVDPAAAIESGQNPHRLVARDPNSATGEAIRLIGYSPTADRVLVIILIPEEHPPTGLWHVATAWPANRRQRTMYTGGEYDEEDR